MESQAQRLYDAFKLFRGGLSQSMKISAAISAVVGAVLGVVISLIVNSTLIEISVSPFFSLYFGILFISVGGIILWRINTITAYQNLTDEEFTRKKQLMFFSIMIIVAGCMCFCLERHFFVGLPYVAKIPLYTILGIAVAFALCFALVDVLNYTVGFAQISLARPLVESPYQVFLVLATSLTMGGVFGFIFGVMDIEDQAEYTIKLALMKEEHYCYPIGILLGGLAGFGNEMLRQSSDEYSALQHTDFDDDI